MTLFRIVLRNVDQRRLSSALTTFSIALGVAAVTAILSLQHQGRENFSQSAFGYELVVGARGSATQLVLNTVYHLDRSPGNIPIEVYRKLAAHPAVALAAPMAVGDAYEGFRVVGTSDRFLRDFEVLLGRKFEPAEGDFFAYTDAALERALGGKETTVFQAVLGSLAARRTGLRVGSEFSPAHGLDETGREHSEHWKVVGILAPTGTPADRAIYINIDSFFSIQGHKTERQEISAVVVKTKRPQLALMLRGEVSAWPEVMAVAPAEVVGGLLDQLAPIGPMMLVVAAFVIVVAGISILVSIYNSMAERRRAIAIMRALGARRTTIFLIVLLEAAWLCVSGGVLGIVLGHGLVAAAAPVLYAMAGIPLSPWVVLPAEGILFVGLVVLGILVGLLPAFRAYKVEIADGLAPS